MDVWDIYGNRVPGPKDQVQNDLNQTPMLNTVPPFYFLGVMIPTADGSQMRLAMLPGDVFLQDTIVQVGQARQMLVDYFQQLNDAQQQQIAALQAMDTAIKGIPVTKLLTTNLSVPFTATTALLGPTTKTVTVTLNGIKAGEAVDASPVSLPAGWGHSGVRASADNTLQFTLTVPAMTVGAAGTCTFAIFAQRPLGSS